MSESRLVLLNQFYMTKATGLAIQDLRPYLDLALYRQILGFCLAKGFYPRHGLVTTPFRSEIDFFQARIPTYQPEFSQDFSSITDNRARSLQQNHGDRPWIVSWSGGIDSTLIVCAILKNFSKKELTNVRIALTPGSVFENQEFFDHYVRDNFQLIARDNPDFYTKLAESHLITGEPADMLLGGGTLMNAANQGIDITQSWRSSGDRLIDWISGKIGYDAARWLWEMMEGNIQSLDESVPSIDTIADWFWWINFGWKWIAHLHSMPRHAVDLGSYYQDSKINWFDHTDYQLWSMTTGRFNIINHGAGLDQYKRDSKAYIADVANLPYFARFKTKLASSAIERGTQAWIGMLASYQPLTLDHDRAREKLHEHLV